MKTTIIILVLILVALYCVRGFIRHFKGEDDCCGNGGCPGGCHCNDDEKGKK